MKLSFAIGMFTLGMLSAGAMAAGPAPGERFDFHDVANVVCYPSPEQTSGRSTLRATRKASSDVFDTIFFFSLRADQTPELQSIPIAGTAIPYQTLTFHQGSADELTGLHATVTIENRVLKLENEQIMVPGTFDLNESYYGIECSVHLANVR